MKKIHIIYFIYALVISLLILLSYNFNFNKDYYLIIIIIVIFVTLPIVDAANLNYSGNPNSEKANNILYNVFKAKAMDEIISKKFIKSLRIMKINSAKLMIYNNDTENFYLYSITDKSLKKPVLLKENFFLNNLNSEDIVIIKNKLSGSTAKEKKFIDEMNKLNVEIIVPVFYGEFLLGAIMLGDIQFIYNDEDIYKLKLISKKIAALLINDYFAKEMYRKKALDFERKLAFKVMKSFFPSFNSKIGDFSISIVFKNPGTIIDKFFNYYYYKEKLYFVYFHLEKTNPSLSIFLPALNAVLQYASLSGCTIQESVEKCRSVLQNKFMMDEKVEISLFSVNPEGLLEMSTPRDGSFMLLHENRNILEIFPENKIRLDKKNVLIICNSIIHEIIIYNQELILNILNKDTGLSEKNIELIQFIRKNFLISDSFHFLFLINYDK